MLTRVIQKLKTINPWHYLWISIIGSEAVTALMNTMMSLGFWGRVSKELLIIGSIDAFIVPAIVGPIVIYFIRHTSRLMEYNEQLKREIVEREEVERRLKGSEERFKLLFEFAPDAYYLIDLEGNFIDCNRAAEEMCGYKKEEFVGKNMLRADLLPPEEVPKAAASLAKSALARPTGPEEFILIRKDGARVNLEVRAYPVEADGRTLILGIARDVTQRKQAEEELERQAFYDRLTGLPNRHLFMKFLSRLAAHSKRQRDYQFAVLFLDLDRFKVVNDSLGHITGDELLIAVARRLQTCVRADDLIARFGGDEFVVLIDGIKHVSDATLVAERIHQELSFPFNLGPREIFTSASIGIALSASGYENEEDLLRDADSAMYRAKSKGRACYEIFDTSMHSFVTKLLQTEADLRRAVERQEFVLHYQPIISTKKGGIMRVEALLRWQHPKKGLVLPSEFISVAEDTGLIVPIGQWALRKACAQVKTWLDAGHNRLRLGVNFSARQFQQKDLPEFINNTLRETGLHARLLDVEITESIVMESACIETLKELSALGVRVSIDDFGTGYSSLGSLNRFPISIIKIDKSFIKDLTADPNAQTIVKAIITMAHSLNVQVVAEGVETDEQLEFLRSHGCDEVQGYLFGRPVPGEEFLKLLKEDAFLLTESLMRKVISRIEPGS